MKSRWFWAALITLVGLAVCVGNVLATDATPAPGFAGKTLAMATFGEIDSHVHTVPASWQEMIKTKGLSDLYVQQNTWNPSPPPAGCGCTPSTGWHTHPGPSLVTVTAGTITAYEADAPNCTATVYHAGESFTDLGCGDVHLLRNEGPVCAVTIAVQIIPAGQPRRLDADQPANCPTFTCPSPTPTPCPH